MEVPQLQLTEKLIDVPAVLVAHAPQVQVVVETVEIRSCRSWRKSS